MKRFSIIFLVIILVFVAGYYLGSSSAPPSSALSGRALERSMNERSKKDTNTIERRANDFIDPPETTDKKTYTVGKVFDGDTIELASGETIRYIGMNASETGEPCAAEATDYNRKLVLGEKVRLEYDVERRDKYGRLLAYVWKDGEMVNLKLVKEGYANTYTFPPNVKYADKFRKAERAARKEKRGCWAKTDTSEKCIEITRIHADAPGNDNYNKNEEWIEIRNTCDEQKNLDGWLLKDNSAANRYTFEDKVLEPHSSLKLHSGCGNDSQEDLYWQCPEREYAVWNNSGDHGLLYNDKGELVDQYRY